MEELSGFFILVNNGSLLLFFVLFSNYFVLYMVNDVKKINNCTYYIFLVYDETE